MALTSISDLIGALATSQQVFSFVKTSATAEAAGTYIDLALAGGMPGAISAPATIAAGGTLYTSASAGFFDFTAPPLGKKTYLASVTAVNSSCLSLVTVYDRLWACSGIPMTVSGTTTSIATPPVLPRYADGKGVELYYYCLVTPNTQTGTALTVSYTNSAGVSARTANISVSIGTTPFTVAGTMVKAQLQAGDLGVQTIASVTNTLTMTGANPGNHGLMLLKRVLDVPVTLAMTGTIVSGLRSGLVEIPDGAALNLMIFASTTFTGTLSGSISLVQG